MATEIAVLCDLLRGAGWQFADALATQLLSAGHIAAPASLENIKRRIRAVANASDGRILSYPGSPGYKLTREATIEEIQTAVGKIRHQSSEMLARALQIDRVYHGKLKG